MKVLLAQNLYYLPSRGGANKSNRLMLEQLARRGHECHAVAPLSGQVSTVALDDLPDYLAQRGARILDRDQHVITYEHRGVVVHGAVRASDLPRTLLDVAEAVTPDWALVTNDDPAMMMLSAALRRVRRLLYLVHTLPQLPFGPRSFYPSAASTDVIRRATGIVSISRATHDYVKEWSGMSSTVIYPDVYSTSEVRDPVPAEQRYVTLINACAYKGISIFLAMADALPGIDFLAVEGWGTTDADRAELARRPNVTIVPGTDDVNEIYSRTKVLTMPSLWDETFGYCCVEAMMRGIPVLAADVCGMDEAKLGVDHLLPVRPITRYPETTVRNLPPGQIPAQDAQPWIDTLQRLLGDDAGYARLAAESRQAAWAFINGLDPNAVEAEMHRLEAA